MYTNTQKNTNLPIVIEDSKEIDSPFSLNAQKYESIDEMSYNSDIHC